VRLYVQSMTDETEYQIYADNELYYWFGTHPMEVFSILENKDTEMLKNIYRQCLEKAELKGHCDTEYSRNWKPRHVIDMLRRWVKHTLPKQYTEGGKDGWEGSGQQAAANAMTGLITKSR